MKTLLGIHNIASNYEIEYFGLAKHCKNNEMPKKLYKGCKIHYSIENVCF